MIIFKQSEYNAWAALNEKYLKLRSDARREYGKTKNRSKYEARCLELDALETDERDKIEGPAKIRTVKNLSSKRIVEDAHDAILYYTFKVYQYADETGQEPDFHTYGGSFDLRVDEHLIELRGRGNGAEAQKIDDMIDRFKAGEITREEATTLKDYEPIRVEVPVNKSMAPISEDINKALVIKNTSYPDQFVTPKDKVSNKLFEGAILPLVETTVDLGRKTSKLDISTVVTINYDDLQAVELVNRPKGLTAYDREVSDAITSLYVVGGNEIITDQMIYRVMTGNPDAKLTKTSQEAIAQSVRVLRGTIVKLNASNDLAECYGAEKISYEGQLITLETVNAQIKGQTINAYKINRVPVLYQYADGLNQVVRIPIDLLNTSINKTPDVITLQGYLMRRIAAMKGSQLSKVILYSTIYDNIGIFKGGDRALTGSERNKINKINGFIIRILNEWKEKDFIVDYKLNYKGKTKTIVSVRIDP